MDDYFSLFGLPARHAQDSDEITRIWKTLAARVHPDRYASASAAEQSVALQWAARINDAYRVLRDPLARARYLCEQAGVALDGAGSAALPAEFLMQQIQWREQLDSMRHDPQPNPAGLTALADELADAQARKQASVSRLLDEENNPQAASAHLREWMFLAKLAEEIAAARAQRA